MDHSLAYYFVLTCRYSSKIAKVFGKNSVPVLATLFLLSYAKLIQLIVTALSYTFVEFPYGKKAVWSADGNIEYLENPHLLLFLAAVAILVFLWLPYTLSAQWLQKYNLCIITSTLNRMKPFLDAHYGPRTGLSEVSSNSNRDIQSFYALNCALSRDTPLRS